jgi:hypothetical protein
MNDDYIYINRYSLSDDTCNSIINMFDNDPNVHEGVILNGLININVKKTNDLNIDIKDNNHKIFDEVLYKELNTNLNAYLSSLKEKNILLTHFNNISDDGFHIQKYEKNNGFYKYHVDQSYNVKSKKIRIIAYIWYLNTVEVGGETEFLNGKYNIKPEVGKLILFPALWTYPHKGNIPISNDKYIITGWCYADTVDEPR